MGDGYDGGLGWGTAEMGEGSSTRGDIDWGGGERLHSND